MKNRQPMKREKRREGKSYHDFSFDWLGVTLWIKFSLCVSVCVYMRVRKSREQQSLYLELKEEEEEKERERERDLAKMTGLIVRVIDSLLVGDSSSLQMLRANSFSSGVNERTRVTFVCIKCTHFLDVSRRKASEHQEMFSSKGSRLSLKKKKRRQMTLLVSTKKSVD